MKNEELLQLSQHLNANCDHGDHSEGNASEYDDTLDPNSLITSDDEVD